MKKIVLFWLNIVFVFCILRTPSKMKEIPLVLTNLAHPSFVLTKDSRDFLNDHTFNLTLRRLSKKLLKNQLFLMHQDFYRGVVFKSDDGLRTFPTNDTIKLGEIKDSIGSREIYLKKEKVGDYNTFRLITGGKCIAAEPSIFKKDLYFLRIVPCKRSNEQLWGVFTGDKIAAELKITEEYSDPDDFTIQNTVNMIAHDDKDMVKNVIIRN